MEIIMCTAREWKKQARKATGMKFEESIESYLLMIDWLAEQ